MKCPLCNGQLELIDDFGSISFCIQVDGVESIITPMKGEIYQCVNDNCKEDYFYTFDGKNKLQKGYPHY